MKTSTHHRTEKKQWAPLELHIISKGGVASGTHNAAHEGTLVKTYSGGNTFYKNAASSLFNVHVFPLAFFES